MAAGSDPCMTVRTTITLLPERDLFARQTVHSPSHERAGLDTGLQVTGSTR